MKVTFKGDPLTLVGRKIRAGIAAPEFRVVAQDMSEVRLSDLKGKVKLISVFPSLDTPVCDLQVKEFNKRAAALSETVEIVGISKDLPFAQRRFCQHNDIEREKVFSDYKYGSFGLNYGLLIKELNLLARAVIVIGADDVVRYVQVVPEVTSSVDFDAALRELAKAVKGGAVSGKNIQPPLRCVACEGTVPALPKEKAEQLLAEHRGWQLLDGGKRLFKEARFKDFKEALYFVDMLGAVAEDQGHHPDLEIRYNKVGVSLTTHAARGLTQNDFIMASIIDELYTD